MTSSEEAKSLQNFPALTGVRALAAYLVFCHHYTAEPHVPLAYSWDTFWHQGYIGVSIFFTLSGFLIALRYEENIKRIGILQYFWNRFARVYPLYFILCLIHFFFANEWGVKSLILNLTLLKGLSRDWVFSGISQSWSLTVEECFYLLAPLIFILSAKIRLAGVLILIYLSGLGLYLVSNSFELTGFFASARLVIIYTFFGRCFEFIVGIWLARLIRFQLAHSSLDHAADRKIPLTYLGTALILMIMWVFSLTQEMGIFDRTGIVVHHYFLPIATAFWFYGLLTEKTRMRFFLEMPIMQLLGKSSYAFYLIHYGSWQMQYVSPHLKGSFLLNFIVFNIIAVLLYLLVEKPVHSILKGVNFRRKLSI